MRSLTDRYVNPFTDFGFKRLFGEEMHKDFLKDFLNELLKDQEGKIVDLTYLKSEQLGLTGQERKAIFDLYCENERGERFIVEMQKTKHNFFKDRSVYYSTFPIQQQAQKNNWNYKLNAVYTIAILDFVFDEDKEDKDKFRYDVKLQDIDTNKNFYDKLTFIYFEMPKFNKTIDELETRYDKWLYVLQNLPMLDRLPDKLKEKIFEEVFEVAEIAHFTNEEYMSYENSLKYYRDLKNSFDTAREEGLEKGIEQGIEQGIEIGVEQGIEKGIDQGIEMGVEKNQINVAINSIKAGLGNEIIHQITGWPVEKIEELRRTLE